LGASAIVVLVVACRARIKAGDACKSSDRLRCSSNDRALACESGRWRELACLGPGGCSRRGDDDDCDDALAAVDDPCPLTPPADFACTADHTTALMCHEGRFAVWRHCRGAEGCAIVGERRVSCDTTLGEVGDLCEKTGSYACSSGGGAMLQCDGAALGVVSACRGPDGCRFDRDSHKVDCDDGLALDGDPCDRPERIACAVDRKSELVCDKGRYVKKRECRRSDCRVDGSALFCE
jgi:hypothetical protein